jgi:hypothetical protein
VPKNAHFQDFTCIGAVRDVIVKGGQVVWIALEIDQREPCLLALAPGRFPVPPDLARHDLLHVRGELYTEHGQGSRHGMPYLLATRVLERLRRGRPLTANGDSVSAGGLPTGTADEERRT